MNGLRIFLGFVAFGIAAFAVQYWVHSRPGPVVSAAIDSADTWFSALDGQGFRVACSGRFVGENWPLQECLSALGPYYEAGVVKSRGLESSMHLSDYFPQYTEGERVLLVYRSRFASGEAEEHVIMAYQSVWKVDGYFVRERN